MNLAYWFLMLLPLWHLGPWPHQNGNTPSQPDCIPASIRSHLKSELYLETETIGEEGKDCLCFLATCGTVLWASPKAHGVLVTSFHLLLGNAPLSTLLNIPPSIFHLT